MYLDPDSHVDPCGSETLSACEILSRFVPRKEREKELGEKAKKFTNVYIKNFGEDLGEDKLKEIFSKFGKITSYKVVSKVLLKFSGHSIRESSCPKEC